MDVGEAAVDAVVPDGEPFVIDAQLMKEGGVDVVDVGRMVSVERFETPLVALAIGSASDE